jgi:hypothetical protein
MFQVPGFGMSSQLKRKSLSAIATPIILITMAKKVIALDIHSPNPSGRPPSK